MNNKRRDVRNGDVVYDISVEELGILGYLYPEGCHSWAYDIVMYPNGWSKSGTDNDFYSAQQQVI